MLESLQQIDEQLFLWFNGSNSGVMDMIAVTESSSFAWVPFALSIMYVLIKNNEVRKSLLIMLCLLVIYLFSSVLVSSFIQPSIARLSPAVDLDFCDRVDLINGTQDDIHGMFSHQASKFMAFSMFLMLQFREKCFAVFALIWTLFHGWVLLYMGHCYPLDILVGLLWGIFVALIVFLVYKKIERMSFDVHEQNSDRYTAGGYLQEDIDIANFIYLVNFVGILIISIIRY